MTNSAGVVMQHDYKQAIEYAQHNYELAKELGYSDGIELAADTLQALRIADALMQDPSEAMKHAGGSAATFIRVEMDQHPVAVIWKAMRDQLLKEVGE